MRVRLEPTSVPVEGFEPSILGLWVECSTTVLRRHSQMDTKLGRKRFQGTNTLAYHLKNVYDIKGGFVAWAHREPLITNKTIFGLEIMFPKSYKVLYYKAFYLSKLPCLTLIKKNLALTAQVLVGSNWYSSRILNKLGRFIRKNIFLWKQ